MRHCTGSFALAFTLLFLQFPPPVQAGKPVQVSLEERVAKADFIGIVECETAGGLVARYKVIESCRGARAGERIDIRVGVNYWGQQFSIALCGRRYLFIAYRTSPKGLFYSKSVGSGVPLWWRRLPADYEVPFGQGPISSDVNTFYQKAKTLAAKQPAAPPAAAPKVEDVVWKAPDKQPPARAQLDAWRAQLASKGSSKASKKDTAEALDGLLLYDPGSLFLELVNWVPDEANIKLRRAEVVWAKASYFAWRCGQERVKNLKLLLTAREPIVRVAGAVYLCFEDEKAGMKELAKLTKLEGEAGAWAALTLARRGEKNAVPRVLQMFSAAEGLRPDGGRESHMHAALRVHALTLFSNSAQKSGVPQPQVKGVLELARADDINADGKLLQQWWQENAKRINLHDPWLETLSKQKID